MAVIEELLVRNALPAAFAASVMFVIWYLMHAIRSYNRLSHFPGPKSAGFSSIWLLRKTLKGNLNLRTGEVIRKYGSMVRITPNLLITSEVELLRRMSAPRSSYTRAVWYEATKLGIDDNHVFSETNDVLHTARRSKLSAGYSGKDVPGLEQSIDNHCESFANLIRRRYLTTKENTREMDFAVVAQYFTLDVLTEVAFGAPFGYLEHDMDVHEYIKTVHNFVPVFEMKTISRTFSKFIDSSLVQALLAPSIKDATGMGKLKSVAQRVVAERFGENAVQIDDMLGSFIRKGITQQEAESETMLQILAGADTTATAIRVTFLHILTNPMIYVRLRAEVDSFLASSRISSPVIRNSQAKEMPYLQACIKEGLRIWPPLTGLSNKVVPPDGDTFNGMFLPGGTEIAYSAWGVHHDKRVYGEDADVYRPERWLETEGEALRAMERSVELIFGSGRYGCLGKTVALIELNKVFVQLVRQFDFGLVNPIVPIKTHCHGSHQQKDMWIRVTERIVEEK